MKMDGTKILEVKINLMVLEMVELIHLLLCLIYVINDFGGDVSTTASEIYNIDLLLDFLKYDINIKVVKYLSSPRIIKVVS